MLDLEAIKARLAAAKSIYAGAVVATSRYTNEMHIRAVQSTSEVEARKDMLRFAEQTWPRSEGWYDHQVTMIEVPQSWCAAAPDDVAALVAEVERLRRENGRLRQWLMDDIGVDEGEIDTALGGD